MVLDEKIKKIALAYLDADAKNIKGACCIIHPSTNDLLIAENSDGIFEGNVHVVTDAEAAYLFSNGMLYAMVTAIKSATMYATLCKAVNVTFKQGTGSSSFIGPVATFMLPDGNTIDAKLEETESFQKWVVDNWPGLSGYLTGSGRSVPQYINLDPEEEDDT